VSATVAYVVGSGRSGSTLLDLLLGRLDGWFSMGELRHLWHAQRDDYLCGCGEPVTKCPVWSEVLARSRPGEPEAVLADVRATLRIRHLAGLADRRLLSGGIGAAAVRLRETLASVYGAASSVTGARVLVDSSKDPLYGLLLDQIPELRVHAIHLVRDPRAVAWSEQRTRARPELGDRLGYLPIRSARQTSLEWDVRNALARVMGTRSVTYSRVTYEELVAAPEATVDRIAHAVTGTIVMLGQDEPRGHTVGGNPMRFDRDGLRIKPDVEWRTALSVRNRRTVNALTWPLLRHFGYSLS
jgi:hypothetical protein